MTTPKSNKMKRKEKEKKELRRIERERKQANSFASRKAQIEAENRRFLNDLSTAKIGTRNPKETLKLLYNGENVRISSSSRLTLYKRLLDNHPEDKKRAIFCVLNRCIDEGVEFFHKGPSENRKFINAISGLANHQRHWIRPVEEWKSPSYNCYKQFSSLARHLFAKYFIPSFMDDAFYSGCDIHQNWFIHVGKGLNIRTALNLPIPLTKKAAHYMMQAPNDFDINSAIRWGQIHAMGGDERLVRTILKTRIGFTFAENNFWESVFRWFMANPMLDTTQYAPIIDYIHHQRFVQPNLSMKNRSVDVTIKAMEEWHKQSGRNNKENQKRWISSGIPEFSHEEGEHYKKVYSVVELLTSGELKEEGDAMSHCVGSYSASCSTGRTSIWSMRQGESNGCKTRLLTIEVDNKSKTIRQARGKFNALPTAKDKDILNRWAAAAGLSISRWLI